MLNALGYSKLKHPLSSQKAPWMPYDAWLDSTRDAAPTTCSGHMKQWCKPPALQLFVHEHPQVPAPKTRTHPQSWYKDCTGSTVKDYHQNALPSHQTGTPPHPCHQEHTRTIGMLPPHDGWNPPQLDSKTKWNKGSRIGGTTPQHAARTLINTKIENHKNASPGKHTNATPRPNTSNSQETNPK